MNFFGQTGAFLMSIFFGRIVDISGSFDAPQFLMVGVLVVGALMWIRMDVTKKISGETERPVVSKADNGAQKLLIN
jgi:ACS family glucarate transporter-like MFS transporter